MSNSTSANIGKSMETAMSKIGKSMDSVSSQIDKAASKAAGTNKLPHVAPGKMPAHVSVEHGVRPPAHSGNAATTGQANAYSLPN